MVVWDGEFFGIRVLGVSFEGDAFVYFEDG
jgi:hypothetical protein